MKRVLFISIPLLIVIGIVAAGVFYATNNSDKKDRKAKIISIMNDSGRVEPAAEKKDVVREGKVTTEGDYKYIEEVHDVVDNIDGITYLGLNDDVIWPGSLIKGDKVHSFIYTPITIDRAPVTISLSLEGATTTGKKIAKTINDPKLSTVRQGISDLLKEAITEETHVPAKVDFKVQQVYSESQLNLFIGADISYGAGSLKTKFNWDSTSKRNKIVARYQQIYYTVDIDLPKSPADLFAQSVSTEEIAAGVPEGSLPMYVSSVSYGMMALIFIESNYDEDKVKAALNAAYKAAADASVQMDLELTKVLETSNIRIVVYGGSTAGLQNLETGYTGFKNVIEASRDFAPESPGVPLTYKFHNAADNTQALVTLTSQYTFVRQLKIKQKMRITVVRFYCVKAADGGFFNSAVDIDRLGVWVTAYQQPKDGSPEVMVTKTERQEVLWYPNFTGGWPLDTGQEIRFEPLKPDEEAPFKTSHSIDVVFDTENYDFDQARLVFHAWARDWDTSDSDSEEAKIEKFEIFGSDFFAPSNTHYLTLWSSDFTIRVDIKLELID